MAEAALPRSSDSAAALSRTDRIEARAGRSTRLLVVSGRVQGVGFRPFVFRLARRNGLNGYVLNRLGEVEIVVSGEAPGLSRFERELIRRAPPLARPTIASAQTLAEREFGDFRIRDSQGDTEASVSLPPDYFMCDDCRQELDDPSDRRFGYPFINCTQCGPRYTLIEALPYDRPNTSMAAFALCEPCQREYDDPTDRRFHAEPVACPDCGPSLRFVAPGSAPIDDTAGAIDATLGELARGRIVAVRGIGGYHLMADAASDAAIQRLRRRKHRPAKPFAVMFPWAGADGLDAVRRETRPSTSEAAALSGPMRPIVLIGKRAPSALSADMAPGLDELGVMLPYSPLHHLLLTEFAAPLVATSGNVSGEPVLTDPSEAERRLADVADAFLHHDRPIVRPADDPVMRRIGDTVRPLRHGRGSAPLELDVAIGQPRPTLAVGAEMKGTVALAWDKRVVVSPHIGEMDSPRSLATFARVVDDLQALYGVQAERIVCDAHSGYATHRWATEQPLPVETVWHHHAHASAVAGEANEPGDWLVFTWDGLGLGEDGTLWGGEALLGLPGDWRRFASFRPFRLPGGERAGREPWRSAAALAWTAGGDIAGLPDPDGLAFAAWQRQLNAPQTSAAGRLFDAAAMLVLGTIRTSFEAEGPMRLEALCRGPGETIACPLVDDTNGIRRTDWAPLLAMLTDSRRSARERAETFHTSMAGVALDQARAARHQHGIERVGLGGGVFQNRVLTEQTIEMLERDGFRVALPAALPANDAAISFGQAIEVAVRTR